MVEKISFKSYEIDFQKYSKCHYSSDSWLARKIAAIPKALILGPLLLISHAATAVFIALLDSGDRRRLGMQVNGFKVLRDLEQITGYIIMAIPLPYFEKWGSFVVHLAVNNKEAYDEAHGAALDSMSSQPPTPPSTEPAAPPSTDTPPEQVRQQGHETSNHIEAEKKQERQREAYKSLVANSKKLSLLNQEQAEKIKQFKKEKEEECASLQKEIEELELQLKEKRQALLEASLDENKQNEVALYMCEHAIIVIESKLQAPKMMMQQSESKCEEKINMKLKQDDSTKRDLLIAIKKDLRLVDNNDPKVKALVSWLENKYPDFMRSL